MKIRYILSVLPILAGQAFPAALPRVTNHWVANTGGGEAHIQNFIEDMVVWYPTDKQHPSPLVLTKSFWDEGHCGICAYHNGKNYGKAEWWVNLVDSRTASRDGKTCKIGNFYGRAFLGKVGPPPAGEQGPYIACDGNDTLRVVADPTALAFDRGGLLLVADNGPDQNIKFFDLAAKQPRLVRTFGDSGGVFAGPVPGKAGTRRLWGPRGLGVDSVGNLYVGTTGLPMQVGGGTDIRVYKATDSSLLWQVQGLSFVNSGDADPDSAGRSVFLNAERFSMDFDKTPGSSWKLAAATIDPFRYPDDPRVTNSLESVFVRRIGGKLFLYLTDMYLSFAAVVRFEPGSEIGIPTAFFTLGKSGQSAGFWGEGKHPVWPETEGNKLRRWMWRDANGNGQVEADEFSEFNLAFTYNLAFDVDERGDMWFGGQGKWDTKFQIGGLLHMPVGGLDGNGIPRFSPSGFKVRSIPFSDFKGYLFRMKHLVESDAMLFTSGAKYPYSSHMWRVDHWSDTARMTVKDWAIPYDDHDSAEIRLDANSGTMILPMSFTSDSQYVYIAYMDKGPKTGRRGEITVLDAKDGRDIGYIAPGPETEYLSGAVDLPNGVNVRIRPDGSRVLFVEEDGKGKVMVYHWVPPLANTVGTARRSDPTRLEAFWGAAGLHLRGDGWTHASLRDASGRRFGTWNLMEIPDGSGGRSLVAPAALPRSTLYLSLQGENGERATLKIPPRF